MRRDSTVIRFDFCSVSASQLLVARRCNGGIPPVTALQDTSSELMSVRGETVHLYQVNTGVFDHCHDGPQCVCGGDARISIPRGLRFGACAAVTGLLLIINWCRIMRVGINGVSFGCSGLERASVRRARICCLLTCTWRARLASCCGDGFVRAATTLLSSFSQP